MRNKIYSGLLVLGLSIYVVYLGVLISTGLGLGELIASTFVFWSFFGIILAIGIFIEAKLTSGQDSDRDTDTRLSHHK